ncbi:MAG: ORF6N domain-containing protein [Candidatus Omnitrophica bacterium]|nr:ORF6N domain-containing protein [Candidatus Omnitrophota bacterium]
MANVMAVEVIAAKILLIRGKKVMLDRDLAKLYRVETRVLNQAVKRNSGRFPEDFAFSLTREEIMRISQSVISLKFSKTAYAFTEQGVAMLSSVLNSERAIKVNIQIMRAFVKLKEYIFAHKELSYKLRELEEKIGKHDADIKDIFETLRQLLSPPIKKRKIIGFHS